VEGRNISTERGRQAVSRGNGCRQMSKGSYYLYSNISYLLNYTFLGHIRRYLAPEMSPSSRALPSPSYSIRNPTEGSLQVEE
jgi:hypothetical protein